jgi:hypothetical protein
MISGLRLSKLRDPRRSALAMDQPLPVPKSYLSTRQKTLPGTRHQVLTLANSADNPSQTPLSHLEGTTILKQTDAILGRDAAEIDLQKANKIRGCLERRMSSMQLTLNDDQKSSIQLTMTIRNRHTPTAFNYPCRHSFTNAQCSSRVSRYRWKGRNG